ncbi:hypothetical protein BC831DRAFT_476448 [Entophlyctis helioformis]|nr:hypothetical protein BC831DRAFT_476448 [Entophlyctis helioformis]
MWNSDLEAADEGSKTGKGSAEVRRCLHGHAGVLGGGGGRRTGHSSRSATSRTASRTTSVATDGGVERRAATNQAHVGQAEHGTLGLHVDHGPVLEVDKVKGSAVEVLGKVDKRHDDRLLGAVGRDVLGERRVLRVDETHRAVGRALRERERGRRAGRRNEVKGHGKVASEVEAGTNVELGEPEVAGAVGGRQDDLLGQRVDDERRADRTVVAAEQVAWTGVATVDGQERHVAQAGAGGSRGRGGLGVDANEGSSGEEGNRCKHCGCGDRR